MSPLSLGHVFFSITVERTAFEHRQLWRSGTTRYTKSLTEGKLRQHNGNLRKDLRLAFWDDDYLHTAKYQLGFILENQEGTENNTVHSTNNVLPHTSQNISL
jgi:hypothetical protein